jgi:glutaredoxin
MRVQLLGSRGCPHVEETRRRLKECLQGVGIDVTFEELELDDDDAPRELRGWGSPTILVNGEDVGGRLLPGQGASCRLYASGRGAPSAAEIDAALRRHRRAGDDE